MRGATIWLLAVVLASSANSFGPALKKASPEIVARVSLTGQRTLLLRLHFLLPKRMGCSVSRELWS